MMKIRKNTLKKIIAEAARLTEAFDPNNIQANMGTSFMLSDSVGSFDVSGDLLDPADLRRLADTLEQLFSGAIQVHPEDMVGFDID